MRSILPKASTLITGFLAFPILVGCSDDPPGPSPEEVEFAAELGVDLSVMTRTPSGLYLLDEVEGQGTEARFGDQVTVHYTGWLPDGTVFDSSVERGTPLTIPFLTAQQVIPGWVEGLQGMREGGHRLLVIPHQLAYGPEPVAGLRWATLVFRVELIEVGG